MPKETDYSPRETPYIYIRVTDLKNGTINDDRLKYIDDKVREQIKRYIIEEHDLYITIAGTIGDVGEVPSMFHHMNLTENAAKLVFRCLDRRFLAMCLRSQYVQDQFLEKVNQVAQPKLALKRIASSAIAVPPLAEQRRIVSKVDSLMSLCDELESRGSERVRLRERASRS